MTIPEINEQLGVYVQDMMQAQNDLEKCLKGLAQAKSDEEKAYNSRMLTIIGEAKAKGEREPTEKVKQSICEQATEKESLTRRVAEFTREALKSRIDVIQVAISVGQTQAKLLTEELQLSRYGRSNQT